MLASKCNVVIIGGGVIGCAIARELSRYCIKTILVEKEPDVATGTSKANTGLIHAGYHADPKTLKGQLNVSGNIMFDQIAAELHVPFKRIGSLVVALEEDNPSVLEELLKRGLENGVHGLRIVDRNWLYENEPNLSGKAVAALWAPTAGIICPWELTLALAQNAHKNGVEIRLETEVENVLVESGRVVAVQTNRGIIEADFVINAAGLFADKIARMAGIEKISITPRIGEYYVYDKDYDLKVNHIIFPVPHQHSKGTIVNPTVDGNLMIGPTSETVEDKCNMSTSREGLKKIFVDAKKLFPKLTLRDIIRVFAGCRAVDKSEDFVIEAAKDPRGFVNVAGIQSPGLSSAPSIAQMVIEILQDEELSLIEKSSFDPTREKPIRFRELSLQEKAELIEKDACYGSIVCRCETVTHKEILDAIHSPVGATTVDGVKRRTRAGMGRCQSGFCGPKVVKILAEELRVDPTKIRKESKNSHVIPYKIKELLGRTVMDCD